MAAIPALRRMPNVMRLRAWILVAGLALPGALRSSAQEAAASAKQQIEQVIATQAAAWNAGDIDRFMAGYAHTPDLRFASGATVTRGWQETLDRYKAHYPDRAAMGTLAFSDLEITVLAPDAAVVFGHWRLRTGQGEPNGLFTLLFRRGEAGWRIVADHTSAAPEK